YDLYQRTVELKGLRVSFRGKRIFLRKKELELFSKMSTIVLIMENKFTFPTTLFGSKIREELLRLFFTNPDSRYYTRQLESMLGFSVGSLHRELKHLEKMGVLRSEREGNLCYYSANAQYPLFSELKNIIAKTIGVEAKIKEVLIELEGIDIAFIYGSFAAGRERATSDIDLFLIGEIDEDSLNEKLKNLESLLAREINYVSMKKEEFQEEARKKSPLVLRVLEEPKIFIIGDEDELRRLA
ncbi:MAG: nucleotidyltransferase domain-containing protein, partial [Actinomycetota bacterium]|nr:nucleotidyltransferase domain-containing protein [Actinomycetota bacterium]